MLTFASFPFYCSVSIFFCIPWAIAFPLTPTSFSPDWLFRVSFLIERSQLHTD